MKLEQNAVSPIGTPRSSMLGMLEDGIEVGNNDMSLGLNNSHSSNSHGSLEGDHLIV